MNKNHKIIKTFLFSNAVLGGFFLWNSQVTLAETVSTSVKVNSSQTSNSDVNKNETQSKQMVSNNSDYAVNNMSATKSITMQNQKITFIEKDNQYYIYDNESKKFILATSSQIQSIDNAKNTNSIQNNYLPIDRQNDLDNAVNEKQDTVDDYQIRHDNGYDKNNNNIALHAHDDLNNYLDWSNNKDLAVKLQSGELKNGDDLGNGYVLHIVDQLSEIPTSINDNTDFYQTIPTQINGQRIYFYADRNGSLEKWDTDKKEFIDVSKDDKLYPNYKDGNYNSEYLNGDSRNSSIENAVESNKDYIIENGTVYKIIKSTKIDKNR